MSKVASTQNNIATRLAVAVGSAYVSIDEVERKLLSTGLSYKPDEIAEVVVSPADSNELSACVAIAAAAKMPIVARGDMSYTQDYQPEQAGTMLVDLRRMNQVLEINTQNMYVTVQTGCTWKKLYETLIEHNVRTPYYGPLSGMYATVGGALSQNSLFLGSGLYNTTAESAIGRQVVLADGSILQTGSAAQINGQPFYRHFGPDLTGIFTADTGAFGIKSEATLRLIEAPEVTLFMSFVFDTLEQMIQTQTVLARKRICAECCGFDPSYNRSFEHQGFTFGEGLAVLKDVAASKGGIKGLWSSFKVAGSGKAFLRDVNYSLHMTFDSYDKDVPHRALETARAVCDDNAGHEIDNTLSTVFRAHPFGGGRTTLLGKDGEVWIPVRNFLPLPMSKAVAVGNATEAFFAENRELMELHGIKNSYLTCFSGTEFVIESSLYWRDELGEFRLSLIEEEFQEKWKILTAEPEKRKVALELRDKIRDLYDQHGCCHLQIGKYYPYQELISNEPLNALLNGVKDLLDPERKMNPGSFGLR